MNENGTRPEFEVYDVGMINNIAYFIREGVVKTPPYLQFVLGITGRPARHGGQCELPV